MATQDTLTSGLPQDLSARLELIVQTLPLFWAQRRYNHVIDHGPLHSERVHSQKLAQLAQELPEKHRLTNDEIFIVSAAARLYEIGLQSPNLRPVLGFDPVPNQVSPAQLRQIRSKKHELSARLIIDSVSPTYGGPELSLGLARPADEYTDLIALVCRSCSDEALDEVPEIMAVRSLPIRLRLLVALLRLADQLYIDKSRINIELLMLRMQAGDTPANAELSHEELAHLWMYNYVQTLPIGNGQIPFHYFLPAVQREYVGHVRGMIERRFQRAHNPSLRYVWDKYGLVLVPGDTPVIQFDQPGGFRHPMPEQVKLYLRDHVEPIMRSPSTPSAGDAPRDERCLLLLDYEQLMLQLGLEGYFPEPDDLGRLATQLRAEALEQHGVSVDGIAVGHWARPDLQPVAKVLYDNLYDLETVDEGQAPQDRLQELLRREHGAAPGQRLILIAPRRELARAVKEVTDRGRSVTTWISSGREAEIFRGGVGQKHALLTQVLRLTDPRPMDERSLRRGEMACILRLDAELSPKRPELTAAELERFLSSVHEVEGRTAWWRLWLGSQRVVTITGQTGAGRFGLNREHPLVVRTCEQRKALVSTLRKLQRGGSGVRQDELVAALSALDLFASDEQMLTMCLILKDEGMLQRDARPSLADGQPQWFLAEGALSVALSPERYLPHFVVALDHTLVREGLSFLHEHVLPRRLGPALGTDLVAPIYASALAEGWVEARDSGRMLRTSNRPQINVAIVEGHPDAEMALRNRDIFVNFLAHRSAAAGLPWAELHDRLSRIRAFTVPAEEFSAWVEFLEREGVLALDRSGAGREVIKLGPQAPDSLVNYLRGRANVHGLIRNIRRLGAISAERRVRAGELVERLTRYVTGGDRGLAEAAVDYAAHAKLVQLALEETPDGQRYFIWLTQHSFIQRLDRRERGAVQALVELLRDSRGDREGWVPRYVVQQAMEQAAVFGFSRGEHEYWIDQAVHRLKLLEERREPDPKRGMQSYLRIRQAER